MNKTLKDYAPYYIGCYVELFGDSTNPKIRPQSKILSPKDETTLNYIGLGRALSLGQDTCKLLLRKLSNLTDDECIELCSIFYPTPFMGQRRKCWSVRRNEEYNIIDVDNPFNDYTFEIDVLNFSIDKYNKDVLCEWNNIVPCIEYLLRKHFDIFNLIEEGVARDLKEYTEKQSYERI